MHTVEGYTAVYLEYQSVCPFVRIGSPVPSPSSECAPPWNVRGGNTSLRVRGRGSHFGRLERKPVTLYSFWCIDPPQCISSSLSQLKHTHKDTDSGRGAGLFTMTHLRLVLSSLCITKILLFSCANVEIG